MSFNQFNCCGEIGVISYKPIKPGSPTMFLSIKCRKCKRISLIAEVESADVNLQGEFDIAPRKEEESKIQDECSHNWAHLETRQEKTVPGGGLTPISQRIFIYERVDEFYCTKCLELKKVCRKVEQKGAPEWYEIGG